MPSAPGVSLIGSRRGRGATPAPVIHRFSPGEHIPRAPRRRASTRSVAAEPASGSVMAMAGFRLPAPTGSIGASAPRAVGDERADDADVALDDDTRGHAAHASDLLDNEQHVQDRPAGAAVARGIVRPMNPACTRSFTLSHGFLGALHRAARSRKTESASSRARASTPADRGEPEIHGGQLLARLRCGSPGRARPAWPRTRPRTASGARGSCGRSRRRVASSVAAHRELVDQLGGLGADDVDAEDLAGAPCRRRP